MPIYEPRQSLAFPCLWRGTYLGDNSINVHIIADNCWVVPAQLQRNTLQSLSTASHDSLTSSNRSSKGDLINARMLSHHRTQSVISTQTLHNTRREEPGRQLREFQVTVRGKRRRFHDNRVSSINRRHDLPHSQKHGEIPRHDSTRHTHRRVSLNHLAVLGLFNNIGRNFNGAEPPNPGSRHADLRLRLAERLALLHCEGLGESIDVGLDCIRIGEESSSAIGEGRLGPCLESGAACVDSLVQIFLRGDWDLRIGLCGGWVETMAGCGS